MTKQVRVVITGRVQGVWFRGWTVDEAAARGLDGWVRNRRDGTVEAVFSGPEATVDTMIELCQSGPPAARVDTVETFSDTDPVEPGFRQLRDG
ncbi:MAG: acylphosphatase [Alphaproteobacteria bacterium]